jgi:hypothetical protein
MWHNSNIEQKLQALFSRLNVDNMLYIYRDSAYKSAYGVIGLYRCTSGVLATPLSLDQLASNRAIAKVQILVKQIFRLNVQI